MYFTKHEVTGLLNKLVESFHNAEMILETIPASLVKQSENQNLIKKQYYIEAQFHWGIKNGKNLEKINDKINYLEDWHYFDYHKDRWKSISWFSLIPLFKQIR